MGRGLYDYTFLQRVMHIHMCVVMGIGTSAQHLCLLRECKSKPQWTITLNPEESHHYEKMTRENSSVGECVEESEPWYTIGGDAK